MTRDPAATWTAGAAAMPRSRFRAFDLPLDTARQALYNLHSRRVGWHDHARVPQDTLKRISESALQELGELQ